MHLCRCMQCTHVLTSGAVRAQELEIARLKAKLASSAYSDLDRAHQAERIADMQECIDALTGQLDDAQRQMVISSQRATMCWRRDFALAGVNTAGVTLLASSSLTVRTSAGGKGC